MLRDSVQTYLQERSETAMQSLHRDVRGIVGRLTWQQDDADDLAQDVLVAFLEAVAANKLPAEAPAGWLGTTIRNKILNSHRDRKRRQLQETDYCLRRGEAFVPEEIREQVFDDFVAELPAGDQAFIADYLASNLRLGDTARRRGESRIKASERWRRIRDSAARQTNTATGGNALAV